MKRRLCILMSVAMLAVSVPTSISIAATNDKVSDITLPTSMVLSENAITMVKKQPKVTLTATLYPENVDQSVTYESADKKIATVDSLGRISPKKIGSTTITVRSKKNKDLYKTCTVQVVEPTTSIESFETDKEDYHCTVGKRVKLKYEIKPSNASNKYIKWTVDDNKIASVDSNGYVYGIEAGDTTVHAKTNDGGFELDFNIEVSEQNNETYEAFEEDYPHLKKLSEKSVDEGIWLEIENVGKVFYDNYVGEFVKGWEVIDGEQYYFKETTVTVWEEDPNYDASSDNSDSDNEHAGEIQYTYTLPIMQTGWYKSNADWCYLKSDGSVAVNEWVRDNNKWYLFNKEGNMVSNGEKWIGGDRYLFAQSGEAIVGFREVEGSIKHYNQSSCKMDYNCWFQEPDSRWYYADENGNITKDKYIKAMDNSCDFYVGKDGVMVFNAATPDGRYADELGRIGYNQKQVEDQKKKNENYGPGFQEENPATPTTSAY